MTNRREFPDRIIAKIVMRAMNERGQVVCEGCGLVLGSKLYEIDHTIAEALIVDKTKELTAEDGKLLGKECCHDPKTKEDLAAIAKSKRAERKIRLGIRRSRTPMMGSRRSKFKRKVSGEVVLR